MTAEDIKARAKPIVASERKDGNLASYTLSGVPSPVSSAEQYLAVFHQQAGLQKVKMVSKDFTDDPMGRKGKATYASIKSALIAQYGQPTKELESTGNRAYKALDEFYQCLRYSGCGSWASYWAADEARGSIELKLNGTGRDVGYLTLGYEGPQWDRLIDEEKAKRRASDSTGCEILRGFRFRASQLGEAVPVEKAPYFLIGTNLSAALSGCGENSFWDSSCDSQMNDTLEQQGAPEEVKNYQSGNYSSVSWWYWKRGISYTFTFYKQCTVTTYSFSPIK